MSNSKTVNQHYVPQFYLRKFTPEGSGELERLDLDKMSLLDSKGPGGLCSEDFFYALQTGEHDEVSQKIEDWFGHIENHLAPVIVEAEDTILKYDKITEEIKWNITFLMSMLWIRTSMFREWMHETSKEVLRDLLEDEFKHNPESFLENHKGNADKNLTQDEIKKAVESLISNEEYRIEFNNASHLKFFSQIKDFADMFFLQYWRIHISKIERDFITSCDPVTVIVPEKNGFYGPHFLERTHLFPLSPHILIEAKPPYKKTGKMTKRNTILENGSAIDDFNLETAKHSSGMVLARNQKELEVVREAAS